MAMEQQWRVASGEAEIEVTAENWLSALAAGLPAVGLDLAQLARLVIAAEADGSATARDPRNGQEVRVVPLGAARPPGFEMPISSFASVNAPFLRVPAGSVAPEAQPDPTPSRPVIPRAASENPTRRAIPSRPPEGAAPAAAPGVAAPPVAHAAAPVVAPVVAPSLPPVDEPSLEFTVPPELAALPEAVPVEAAPPTAAPLAPAAPPAPERPESSGFTVSRGLGEPSGLPASPPPAASTPAEPPPSAAIAPPVAAPPAPKTPRPIPPPAPTVEREGPGRVVAPPAARLEDRLEELFLRLGEILDARDPATACATALRLASELIPSESGAVLVRTRAGDAMRFRAALGPAATSVLDTTIPLDRGVAGFCFQLGLALTVADVHGDNRHYVRVDKATGYHTRAILAVPVRADDGGVYGVLELLNPPRAFTDEDLELASRVGATLGAYFQGMYR